MFERLTDKIESAFRTLKGQGRISENNISETMKEIRRALLDADVHFNIAKEFTERVKQEALGQNVIKSISPGQLLVKIMNQELAQLMGGAASELKISGNPAVILIAGLQGSGKTTFSAKLADRLHKQNNKVMLVACDVYRPAAIDQLKILGGDIGVEVYSDEQENNPLIIARSAVRKAGMEGCGVVIVDTAGRLAVDAVMMTEIKGLHSDLRPCETLFVVDAMTGQDAVNTARAFHDALNYEGVVLTKMDGDARGGAALSISYTVGKPIKFLSTGEKMQALEVFHPDRMANRILGMGDVVSLVERAQAEIDEQEAERLSKKMSRNQFDLSDFLGQIKQIKKMGNIKEMLGMIPGMSKAMKDMDISDSAFVPVEAMILSMTPGERANPDTINASRKERIARGSGTSVQQVNQLLKQFQEMKEMIRKMNQGPMGFPGMPGGVRRR
ncbi:MAG: signal recognition particle protein [Sphingomonadales bacterium]|nr:signal recognition particle protein [Sphingomonadales bacterium]